jgi:isoleucyl-tRNA synthetase
LIDVWFDSIPYAQWHYPLKIRIKLTQIKISLDFIAEGVDQTRGWFYTLHAIATLVLIKWPIKVVSNGLVLDKTDKMSRSV